VIDDVPPLLRRLREIPFKRTDLEGTFKDLYRELSQLISRQAKIRSKTPPMSPVPKPARPAPAPKKYALKPAVPIPKENLTTWADCRIVNTKIQCGSALAEEDFEQEGIDLEFPDSNPIR
jgi:hypothetical protein